MPAFSTRSMSRLYTCDVRLCNVFDKVVRTFDCTIIEGHRDEERQNMLHDAGKSQLVWPHSKHNSNPSLAVDVAPYPLNWGDREWFNYFAGFVLATALSMDIKLRWGGDWNGDWKVRDNNFDDLPHYELVD